MKRHGSTPLQEGDQRAASSMESSSARVTGLDASNARVLQRRCMIS
jgi:hypothetical protein